MPIQQKLLACALLSATLISATSAVCGHVEVAIWPVNGRLVGKDEKKSENVSGIACTTTTGFPRACLVIDDEMQAAQFVTVEDGELRAGETLDLIHNQFEHKALELDGEGVAFADNAFYVIGSHGHPRDKDHKLDPTIDAEKIRAKILASSQIVRIRLKPGISQPASSEDVQDIRSSSTLREIIAADSTLKRFVDRRLENNGVTIEGVAVLGGRLFAGFRGPFLENGRIPVLSVSVNALFDGGSPEARLHMLPIGEGRGVRDLAPFENGLLVLAGPSGDGDGPYSVYWWDGSGESIRLLADITAATEADKKRKPEAILPLGEGHSGLRVLVLSDGRKEGGPRAVWIAAP
jgi:hypothetical protein